MGNLDSKKYHVTDDGKVYRINDDGSFTEMRIVEMERKPGKEKKKKSGTNSGLIFKRFFRVICLPFIWLWRLVYYIVLYTILLPWYLLKGLWIGAKWTYKGLAYLCRAFAFRIKRPRRNKKYYIADDGTIYRINSGFTVSEVGSIESLINNEEV